MVQTKKNFKQRARWGLPLLALFAFWAGCATGPSLRALNPDEAKIDVYPTGEVRILGEPVALEDINTVVRRSSTRPQDPIFIRLHGDPDSPEMKQMREIMNDQMLRANHYKYNFISTPMATVSTTDPATGKTEIYVSEQPVEVLSGERAQASVEELMEEQKAYREGTYVSEVAGQKPIVTDEAVEELTVKASVVGGKQPSTTQKRSSFGAVATPTQKKSTSTTTKSTTSSQDDLRKAWERQQQQKSRRRYR